MALRGRDEFRRVLAEGTHARQGAIAVSVLPGPDPAARCRLGLIVRAQGGAVVRNRVRRRLKEAFRVTAPRGRDVIVCSDEGSLSVSFQELEDMLGEALRRAESRS